MEGEYLYLYVVSNWEPEINYFGSNLDNPNTGRRHRAEDIGGRVLDDEVPG